MGPMGPMGPMGSMSSRWPGGVLPDAFWLGLALLALGGLALTLFALAAWYRQGRASAPAQPRRPEELLRERYARGELGWPAYREALVNLLKERCIRGEIELDEYEARLDLLLGEPRARLAAERGTGDPLTLRSALGAPTGHASAAVRPGGHGQGDPRLVYRSEDSGQSWGGGR